MIEIEKFDIATCVTDSLIEVFEMMLSMELELSDEDALSNISDDQIVGSVSLAGRVMGSLIFQVSNEFARQMTASMLGMELDEVEGEEDVKDVISEMCNIVGGNLKSKFCDVGLTCELSPPSFTTGNDFKIESLNVARHERYIFIYEQKPVIVEVGVRISDEKETAADIAIDPQKLKPVGISDVDNFDIKTCISDSLVGLFDTMLSMELAFAEKDQTLSLEGERIVGGVNFIGLLMGSFNIYLSYDFSRLMTSAMLGMEVEEVEGEEEVKDVISEVCNIVGGNLKSKFCDAGLTCDLSTPFYTHGNNFKIESQRIMRYERYAFHYQEYTVHIEVGVKIAESLAKDQTEKDTKEAVDDKGPDSVVSQDDIDALLAEGVNEKETEEAVDDKTPDSVISQDDIDALLAGGGDAKEAEEAVDDKGTDSVVSQDDIDALLAGEGDAKETEEAVDDKASDSVISQDDIDALLAGGDDAKEAEEAVDDKGTDLVVSQDDIDALLAGGGDAKETEDAVDPQKAIDELVAAEVSTSKEPLENKVNKEPDKSSEDKGQLKNIYDAFDKDLTDDNLGFILDIPLEITVELGRARMQINELLNLSPGSVVEFSNLEEEPLNILANKKLIARGKVVVVNEKYGIRITEIVGSKERLRGSVGKS